MCYKFFDESIKALVRYAEWCHSTAHGIVKDALEQDRLVPIYDPRDWFKFKGYYNDRYEVIDGVLVKKPDSESESDSEPEPPPPPRRPPIGMFVVGAAIVGIVLRNLSPNKKAVKRNGCPR